MSQVQKCQSKFTRGEKCVLVHGVVTLAVLLVLCVIYVAHVLVVPHEDWDMFRVTRRTSQIKTELQLSRGDPAVGVGVAYVGARPACNTVLVRARWSLAPAHCLAARAAPRLAPLLPAWRIRYKHHGLVKETDIKRSIFHSYYNADDFDNNIGLFQHLDHINMPELVFPEKLSESLKTSSGELAIVGWSSLEQMTWTPVRVLGEARCAQFVMAVVDATRAAELCLYQTRDKSSMEGVHGGPLVFRGQVVGFHSWSDRGGALPQVALLLEPYRAWIEDTIRMNP